MWVCGVTADQLAAAAAADHTGQMLAAAFAAAKRRQLRRIQSAQLNTADYFRPAFGSAPDKHSVQKRFPLLPYAATG